MIVILVDTNTYFFSVSGKKLFGTPNRIRTGVAAVKGRSPGPLDDGCMSGHSLLLCETFVDGVCASTSFHDLSCGSLTFFTL